MLFLTVALVLAGLALLIVGFVQNSVGYIYAAIVCAVVAGIALVVSNRLARRRYARLAAASAGAGAVAAVPVSAAPTVSETAVARVPEAPASAEPAPALSDAMPSARVPEAPASAPGPGEEMGLAGPPAPTALPASEPADEAGTDVTAVMPALGAEDLQIESVAAAAAFEAVGIGEAQLEGGTGPELAPAAPGYQAEPPVAEEREDEFGAVGLDEERDDELAFPIADYDELRVGEILPLLEELDPDELTEVRDREAAARARGMILRRCAGLLGERHVVSARAPEPVSGRSADVGAERARQVGEDAPAGDADVPAEAAGPLLAPATAEEVSPAGGITPAEDVPAVSKVPGAKKAAGNASAKAQRAQKAQAAQKAQKAAGKAPAAKVPPAKKAAEQAPARKAGAQKAAPAKKAAAAKKPPATDTRARNATAHKASAEKAEPAKKAPAKKAPARQRA